MRVLIYPSRNWDALLAAAVLVEDSKQSGVPCKVFCSCDAAEACTDVIVKCATDLYLLGYPTGLLTPQLIDSVCQSYAVVHIYTHRPTPITMAAVRKNLSIHSNCNSSTSMLVAHELHHCLHEQKQWQLLRYVEYVLVQCNWDLAFAREFYRGAFAMLAELTIDTVLHIDAATVIEMGRSALTRDVQQFEAAMAGAKPLWDNVWCIELDADVVPLQVQTRVGQAFVSPTKRLLMVVHVSTPVAWVKLKWCGGADQTQHAANPAWMSLAEWKTLVIGGGVGGGFTLK